MLDNIKPIAILPLQADPEIAGLLTIGSLFHLELTDAQTLDVWCARTANNRYVIDVKSEHQARIHIEADAPISSLLRLPDGKLYDFTIRVEA